MTSPVTVSERDLSTLVHIVTDSRADLPAEGLPPSLLSDLADQIRCVRTGMAGRFRRRRPAGVLEALLGQRSL
jgi:hypothetical protein